MSTAVNLLRPSGQEYSISVDALSPRQWRLADVNSDGYDIGDSYPPFTDEPTIAGLALYWKAIKDIGTITGSVTQGFWSTTLTVPLQGAGLIGLPDFATVDLMIRTWHGGLPGVIGAAGIDPGRVKIFRGYLRHRDTSDEMDYGEIQYDMRGGASFLQDSSFSRAIDWYAESPSHPAPVDAATLIDHIILQHTNWHPRSEHSVYLPNQTFLNYQMQEGSAYAMLKQVADNEVLDGWVYSSREDQLVISGHPNLVGADVYGNGSSTLGTPIIDFVDSIVMKWRFPEDTGFQVASVTLSALTSDQQDITRTYFFPGGLGSRERWPVVLRSDDPDHVNMMCARLANHLNRKMKGVQLDLPLNLAVDTGDIVTCSHRGKTLSTTFSHKLFVVTDIVYTIDLDAESFMSTITLDEIVL